jgi:ribosomal protein L35AE/L33A
MDGVNSKEEADFYLGKRVAFIYKAKTLKQGTKFRCIWGRVRRLIACLVHRAAAVSRAGVFVPSPAPMQLLRLNVCAV